MAKLPSSELKQDASVDIVVTQVPDGETFLLTGGNDALLFAIPITSSDEPGIQNKFQKPVLVLALSLVAFPSLSFPNHLEDKFDSQTRIQLFGLAPKSCSSASPLPSRGHSEVVVILVLKFFLRYAPAEFKTKKAFQTIETVHELGFFGAAHLVLYSSYVQL